MATAPARQLSNKVCRRFDIPSSLVLIKHDKEEKMLPILSVNEFTKIRLKTQHTGNEVLHHSLVLTVNLRYNVVCNKQNL